MEKIKQQFVIDLVGIVDKDSDSLNQVSVLIDSLPMIQAKFELLALFARLKGKLIQVVKIEILKACDENIWKHTEQSVYTKIASYLYQNDKDNPLREVINNALDNYSIHPKTPVDFKFTPEQEKDMQAVFLEMQPKDKKRR
jgi:hypothetical protein